VPEDPAPQLSAPAHNVPITPVEAKRSAPARKNGAKSAALTQLEAQIHSIETSLKELDQLLEHASKAQKIKTVEALGQEYQSQQRMLDELMARWAALA
jgi:TolA-binding protein